MDIEHVFAFVTVFSFTFFPANSVVLTSLFVAIIVSGRIIDTLGR